MFKRARSALMAVTVATAGLVVPIVTAPTAHANNNDLGNKKGEAFARASWGTTGHAAGTASVDTVDPNVNPTDQAHWAYTPGASITIRVQWDVVTPPHYISPFNNLTLELDDGGQFAPTTVIASQYYSLTAAEQAAKVATRTIRLNKNPFGDGTDPVLLGRFRINFTLSRDSITDPNCPDGACWLSLMSKPYGFQTNLPIPPDPSYPTDASWAYGLYETQGSLLGQSNNNLSANETTIGSTFRFGVVRSFGQSWTAPSSAEQALMSSGHRILIYSNIPPTGGSSCFNNNPRWLLVTADCSGVVSHVNDGVLDDTLRALQNAAAQGNTQAIYTMFHEPHQKLDGSGKCDGPNQPPCMGNATDFLSAFQRVRDHVSGTGGATAACGTAPNYGVVCDRVLLSYTDLATNMVGVDTLRPADYVVDLYTPDAYTYFCYYGNTNSCNDADGAGAGAAKYRSFQTDVSNTGGTGGADIVSIAKLHNKQMLFAEVGAHPGCPNGPSDQGCTSGKAVVGGSGIGTRRDTWFSNMATYLSSNTDAKEWMLGFSYFAPQDLTKFHDWRFVDYGTGNYHGLGSYETNMVNQRYFIKGTTTQTQSPVWLTPNH